MAVGLLIGSALASVMLVIGNWNPISQAGAIVKAIGLSGVLVTFGGIIGLVFA